MLYVNKYAKYCNVNLLLVFIYPLAELKRA